MRSTRSCYPQSLMGGPEASSRIGTPETSAGATAGESVPAPQAPEAAERSPDATRPSSSRALLAADVGTVYTKVYLLEEVGGERRLVAVGRAPSAGADGTLAPRQAL